MNKRNKIWLVIGSLLSAVSMNGAVLLTENFTYADGSLVGASASPWVTNSGTAGQQNVVSGELILNDDESEDTKAVFSSAVTSGIVSASFNLRIDTADVPTSGSGAYFAHFIGDSDLAGTPGDFIGRLLTKTPNITATGAFTLGVSNSGASSVFFSSDFIAGTNYAVTLSYDFTAATTTLAVAGVGSVVATDTAASIVRITDIGFRQASSTGDQFIDSLSVNSASAVPEPSTYGLIAGCLALAGVVMRRRRISSVKRS